MNFYVMIAIGTVAMFALMFGLTFFTRKTGVITVWKLAVFSVLLTLFGVLGTKLMVYIETGAFEGMSFFGAVFFTPIIMLGVAFLFRVRRGRLLDLCAPCECIMLAIMKLICIRVDCCRGRIIGYDEGEYITTPIRFPSQRVELAAALLIAAILVFLIIKGWGRNRIYPIYMIIYGVVRFTLNFFRETEPFIGKIPAGHFWSVISVVIGAALLVLFKFVFKSKKKEQIR